MTRLIFRFCGWVLLLCLIISGGMLTWGQIAADEPPTLPGFESCALPCWAGMLPEKTAFDDAAKYIHANVPDSRTLVTINGSVLTFGMMLNDRMVSGAAYYNRGKVGTIHLNLALPLFDLVDKLGSPDCVWFIPQTQIPAQLILHWRQDDLIIKTIMLANAYGRLDVGSLAQSLEISADNGECANALPWLGFAPAWRYAAQ